MGEVTKEQMRYILKEFKALEQGLLGLHKAFDSPKKLEQYSFEDYERFWDTNVTLLKRSLELAAFINKLDSTEPPFNLFEGDLTHARHTIGSIYFTGIGAAIENIKSDYFEEDGRKRANPAEVDISEYRNMLSLLKYSAKCFETFRKIASGKFTVRRFSLKDVVDEVIENRQVLRHHENFKFEAEIENVPVEFDPTALYWILMRMLSNSENALYYLPEGGWIKLQTYHHKNGSFYLIVKNNGLSIEERAKKPLYRKGGRSMPNILEICKKMGTEFTLKGFPDHTRACLRLPLAK